MRKTLIIIVLFSIGQILSTSCLNNNKSPDVVSIESRVKTSLPVNKEKGNSSNGFGDFVIASKAVMSAVVHIKILFKTSTDGFNNNFRQPYGMQSGIPAMASGFGVIMSEDGYIATNNHVVENASEIEVILPDKRTFSAELIGRDPNTDLALLKIKAEGLPTVKFGNSDIVQVGEWVLAVGYPFSLNTTVTAGIISAKARSIGIINRPGRGNSEGDSGTSGNSSVNRGILGIAFPSLSVEAQYFKQQGIAPGLVNGVFIINVMSGSAAAEAGLKEGDIIQSIDGIQLASSTEFSERIARHRPYDVIKLSYLRDGKINTVSATLKGEKPAKIASNSNESLDQIYAKLGVSFAPLTDRQKQYFNIDSGVVITTVREGVFFDQNGIPIGTIIAFINGKPINNSKDIDQAFLSAQRGNIQIFAIAPDGSKVIFNFSLGA